MKRLALATVAISLTLFACSDSSSDASSAHLPQLAMDLAELQSLECSQDTKGSVVTVGETLTKFKCDGKTWVSLNTPEDNSSSSKKESSSSQPTSSEQSSPFNQGSSSSSNATSSSSEKSIATSSDAKSSSSIASSSSEESSSSEISSSSEEQPADDTLMYSFGVLTDPRDNKEYRILTIDTLTWMIENLRFADSAAVPSLKGKTECTEELCLYTWAAAMDSINTGCGTNNVCPSRHYQGICPDGWRLPLIDDWEALFNTVKSENDSAYSLLLNKYDFWGTMPDTNSTTKHLFWLSNSVNGTTQAPQVLNKNYPYDYYYTNEFFDKKYPSAVRCVKD